MQYSLLTDQLGSTSVVTDQSGAKKVRQLYRPFGESRGSSDTLLTDRQFTGQRSEEASLGSLAVHECLRRHECANYDTGDSCIRGVFEDGGQPATARARSPNAQGCSPWRDPFALRVPREPSSTARSNAPARNLLALTA